MAAYTSTPTRVAIRDLPTAERPQERLRRYGPATLSTTELLAVVLGLSSLGEAEALLATRDGLAGLVNTPDSELAAAYTGIGAQRAARIKAVIELGRRLTTAYVPDRQRIKSPADAARLAAPEMAALEQEELRVLILDTKQAVLKFHAVYRGSLHSAVLRVGEVFKEAIRLNAACIVVLHNHPSGDPTPSPEDVHTTRSFVEAGKLLNIDVLDHLVIGANGTFVSLKERGLGF